MITVAQIKGARGILEWTQDELASAASISRPALNNIERRLTQPHTETLTRIQNALENAGIEFIAGGVRLKEDILDVRIFEGKDSLFKLYDDILETYRGTGGVTLISGVDERRFIEAGGEKFFAYLEKFKQFGIIDKLLIKEDDTRIVIPKEYYRWVPPEIFSQVPYIIYKDRYAIILWGPPVKIVIIRNAPIAESFRKQFQAHWDRGSLVQIGK